jgi:hypothetical protein
MRHILIDHARSYRYAKRGAGAEKVPLEEAEGIRVHRGEELLALDDALRELEAFDPRKSRIIELRFFGGLTVEETAQRAARETTRCAARSSGRRASSPGKQESGGAS